MKGLILDLRFNPGGLLTAAVEVTDLFVESGKIVSTEGRNSPDRVWSAKRFGTYSGFPMAVLSITSAPRPVRSSVRPCRITIGPSSSASGPGAKEACRTSSNWKKGAAPSS